MKTISIHDAKTNLSKYIAAAKRGEDIYIGGYGKPEVKLSIIEPAHKTKRKIGVLKNQLSPEEIEHINTYNKHRDPQWQKVIDNISNKPLGI